jgi:hypothetical protein
MTAYAALTTRHGRRAGLLRTAIVAALLLAPIPAAAQQPASLQIAAPAAGTVVAPGQSIAVSLSSPAGTTFAAAFVVGEDPLPTSDAANAVPAQLTMAVPASIASRRYGLTAFGRTTTGITVQSETMLIDVERPDMPRSIAADMPSVSFRVTGVRSPIALTAMFADGGSVDVTGSSRVSYVSANPAIVSVDANGVLMSAAPGQTAVTATYRLDTQSVQVTIPVTVETQGLTPSRYAVVFADQPVGTPSVPQQIVLRNSTDDDLHVWSITAGGEFVEQDDCPRDRLAAGSTCTAAVTFVPSALGTRVGGLSIETDATVLPSSISLSGLGLTPADVAPPTTAATADPAPGAAGWNASDVVVSLAASDAGASASGVDHISYTTSGATSIPSTEMPGSGTTIAIANEGETIVQFFAADRAGNIEQTKTLAIRVDKTVPSTSCGQPDTLWHAADVSISCSASDAVSGLQNAGDTSFSTSTSIARDTETASALTGSYRVCDVAGNCSVAGPIPGIKIDKRAPDISITFPADGSSPVLNEAAAAAYACADGGSGLGSCVGSVAAGAALATDAPGAAVFSVSSADAVGNAATATSHYSVVYSNAPTCLGEPTRQPLAPIRPDGSTVVKQGSTAPVKFRVCDANGVSIGTPGVVTSFIQLSSQSASGVEDVNAPVESATPDTAFRWDAQARLWIFNLKTQMLASETINRFRISLNDGTTIEFSFKVK